MSLRRSLEKLNRIDDSQQQAYAYTVVKNLVMHNYRRSTKQHFINWSESDYSEDDDTVDDIYTLESTDLSPLDRLIAMDMKEITLAEIEAVLPPESWNLLKARYLDGCKLKEIAAREGMSISAVHRYINKAREIVRRHFDV